MILKIAFTCLMTSCCFAGYSQVKFDSTAFKYANTINKEDLQRHLSILSSDEFEGRKTGESGQKKAGRYIKKQFIKSGLKPAIADTGYFQEFTLVEESYSGVSIITENNKLQLFNDFYYFSNISDSSVVAKEVVFAGYGIEDDNYNDYSSIEVKGKIVIILPGEPMKDGISLITGKSEPGEWSTNRSKKIELIGKKGAAAVFMIDNSFNKNAAAIKKAVKQPRLKFADNETEYYIPFFAINESTAKELLSKKKFNRALTKIKSDYKSASFNTKNKVRIDFKKTKNKVVTENVLGLIEGSEFPEEVVVITAHYDHIGKEGDVIFNGADDDGSGTSAIIEIGEAFSIASEDGHAPKRSVLIMAVSGEEMGLLGSEFYSDNPVFELSNTSANLNIDMIGRTDFKYQTSDEDYIYLIGSDKLSSELHILSEDINREYSNLKLDYTYNASDDPNKFYYRSDHYNFAKHGIPVIFYFRGVHEDYHKPTDTIEKIEFDTIEKVSKLIFHTAWEIANRDEKLEVDKR